MPTIGERLVLLEQRQRWTDARLWGDGGQVAYDQSLEGRMSAVETTLERADALANAAENLRAASVAATRRGDRRLNRWVQVVLALSSVVGAGAAVASAIYIIAT